MRVLFFSLARNGDHVEEKISELEAMGVDYYIICGEKNSNPKVLYRKPIGKYDAINYSLKFISDDYDIIVYNDVDTKIYNFEYALKMFIDPDVSLVFAKVVVREGPQKTFYKMLDFIRRNLLITASGELMIIRKEHVFDVLPMKPCKSEDTYILFKAMENKRRVVFTENCYVVTDRTTKIKDEQKYKRRTVGGIYQALSYTHPPFMIKFFYSILPFISPLLLVLGKSGYYWMTGILLGYVDYLKGDRTGKWDKEY